MAGLTVMKKVSKEKLHLPKIDGITLRWLINIIGVIVVFFIIVFIISAFSIKNTYYSNVESILNSGASSTAVSYFSANLDAGNTLEQSAAEYIDSYSYKEKIRRRFKMTTIKLNISVKSATAKRLWQFAESLRIQTEIMLEPFVFCLHLNKSTGRLQRLYFLF